MLLGGVTTAGRAVVVRHAVISAVLRGAALNDGPQHALLLRCATMAVSCARTITADLLQQHY